MRITLVFPPALCLPNPIYYALPLLAGALKQAGHDVRLVDLNVLAADLLLNRDRVDRILAEAHKAAEKQHLTSESRASTSLRNLIEEKEPKVREAPSLKGVLRDPLRNFQPDSFRHAYATVIESLDFLYMQGPIISPHRETFDQDMIAYQEEDPWTPLKDLYDEALLDEVFLNDPEMVGLSIAFPEQAAESLRLAVKLRRRRKDVHLCFGGPLISLYPDKWFKEGWLFRFADSAVVGDGETAVVELADAIEGRGNLEAVRNLVYLDDRKKVCRNNPEPFCESMDELPLPDFDSADLSLYFVPRPLYPIMLSRGCYWGRCTFCSAGWHKKFRQASKDKIRADVKALSLRYGARYIAVADSCMPPSRALDLAAVVAEENLPVYWYGSLKFEKALLDRSYCRTLSEGGCRSLLLGLESANQRVLDLMNKGFQLEKVPAMLKNLKEADISGELLWFLGFPTETRAEVLRTAQYLLEHRHLFGLAAFVGDFQLHPDTELFRRPGDFGVTIQGVANDNCIYESDAGLNEEEKALLKKRLASTGNRTLVCNGAHLPHLVEKGLDLSRIEQPMILPQEVIDFCTQ
jgi:hypothetical protein